MGLTPRIDRLERNAIINGAMDFWQRVAGNTTTLGAASIAYTADRWATQTTGPTTKSISVVRSTSVPTSGGFTPLYSLQSTVGTGVSSLNSADRWLGFRYIMEGFDYARFNGKSISLSFWFYCSSTGSIPLRFYMYGANRSYVTSFTYNNANTWQYITTTISMELNPSGQTFDNLSSLAFSVGCTGGSATQTSSTNTWIAGDFDTPSSSVVNTLATGTVMRMTMVSLIEGSNVMDSVSYNRCGRTISEELLYCQRYFEKSYDLDTVPGTVTSLGLLLKGTLGDPSGNHTITIDFRTRKRANPTLTPYSGGTGTAFSWQGATTNGTSVSFGFASVSMAVDVIATFGVVLHGFTYGQNNPGLIQGQYTADAEF